MLRLPLSNIYNFILNYLPQEVIGNNIEFIYHTDYVTSPHKCVIKTPLYTLITFNNSGDCLNIYILDVSTFILVTCIKCFDVSSESEFYKGFQFFKYCNNVILSNIEELILIFFNHIPRASSYLIGRVYITDKQQQEQLNIYISDSSILF